MPELPTTPSFRLDQRRALVTGAGRGLGFACAAALAAAGAEVVMVSRSADELDAAAEVIRSGGGHAATAVLDVCDVAKAARWISLQDAFDIVVNNAGTN